jgi:hypothetical protein
MNALTVLRLLAGLALAMVSVEAVLADGDPRPTYQRELAMQKYKGCKYTDEMGKYLYECVKKNNGFGTHWCFDESLEMFCAKPQAAQSGAGPSNQ